MKSCVTFIANCEVHYGNLFTKWQIMLGSTTSLWTLQSLKSAVWQGQFYCNIKETHEYSQEVRFTSFIFIKFSTIYNFKVKRWNGQLTKIFTSY